MVGLASSDQLNAETSLGKGERDQARVPKRGATLLPLEGLSCDRTKASRRRFKGGRA